MSLSERFFKLKDDYIQVGQEIVFEGEKAYVLRISPYLVVKAKDRVVCGALQNRISVGSN